MEFFVSILPRLLLTVVSYMIVPILGLMLNCGRYEKAKAKKIALWNSIIVGGIFLILTSALTDKRWNPAPAILYYGINCAILTKKTIQGVSTMSNTEKTESGSVQHCYTKIEHDPNKLQNDFLKEMEKKLNMGDPAQQEPVTKAKPAPKQDDLIRELQKQMKRQEIYHLSQTYHDKLSKFKRNSRIRWILTFCGFALIYFGVLVNVFPDAEVGLVGLLAVIFTAIHFLINVSIFGWLIQRKIAADRELEQIRQRLNKLEKS